MKRFIRDLAGGFVIIVAAGLIGILVNTVRGDAVPLIQNVTPVSTARHNNGADGPAAVAGQAEGSVNLERVRELYNAGHAFILDARPASDYDKGHIPGAINVPYDRLAEHLGDVMALIPPDAVVVCYCTGPACDFSDQVATELRILGYTRVFVFTGGWEYWTEAGYEVGTTGTDL
jgi:rhodanese-related sulfurtransferase